MMKMKKMTMTTMKTMKKFVMKMRMTMKRRLCLSTFLSFDLSAFLPLSCLLLFCLSPFCLCAFLPFCLSAFLLSTSSFLPFVFCFLFTALSFFCLSGFLSSFFFLSSLLPPSCIFCDSFSLWRLNELLKTGFFNDKEFRDSKSSRVFSHPLLRKTRSTPSRLRKS